MSQRPKNHLAEEVSPYLQQHVHNPVDWYPWGDEAFHKAQEEDKPILLSIGYATCHWCHVMEHESFENDELAEMMNETFVNIKIDREELPQVDSLYMDFAQAMLGGGGGWPLNVVLTPELKPIFAATYLPREGDYRQLGMRQLVTRIKELWNSPERGKVLDQADEILEAVTSMDTEEDQQIVEEPPEDDLLEGVLEIFYKVIDPTFGGIQGAPKFPMGYQINFLLRQATLQSEGRALFCAQKTLDMMHRGGIYDHIGGGFSRYAIDSAWRIPHFEKMLYDNVLLVLSYLEGWQATGSVIYRGIVEDVLGYLLRDMTHEAGGFFSAEDADSEGEEGKFYTWTFDEVIEALGDVDGEIFCEFYGFTPEGNFEGRNVLYILRPVDEFAREIGMGSLELADRLSHARRRLQEIRSQRTRPAKDDKVITAWNGLAIRALAEAGAALNAPHYIEAARRSASFIRTNLWKDGHLLRRWRNGKAGKPACVEDYAFLVSGLLSLFRATGESEWLSWCVELSNVLTSDFRNEEGVLYRSDGQDPNLLVRQIELYDGAEPSGNAVHAENLLRLYEITGADRYREEAESILNVAKGFLQTHPLGGTYFCLSLNRLVDRKAPTLVIALNKEEELRKEIARELSQKYLPHTEVIWSREGDSELRALIPALREQGSADGKTTLYLCNEGVCRPPITAPADILAALQGL